MKEKCKFQIGSRVFFSEYPDFESKDDDTLYVMTGWDVKASVLNFKKDGRDCFFVKDAPKDVLIQETLDGDIPMRAGKFLVPEFAKYLGMTIDDLKLLQPLFDKMDDAHSYENVIYDAYIENGDFTLTDEQRDKAYMDYKKKHKDKK